VVGAARRALEACDERGFVQRGAIEALQTRFEFVWRRGAARCPRRDEVAGPRELGPGGAGLTEAFCRGPLPVLSFPHIENKLWNRVAGPVVSGRANSCRGGAVARA
jgi:hypothetical protein